MKKLINILLLGLFITLFYSCEEKLPNEDSTGEKAAVYHPVAKKKSQQNNPYLYPLQIGHYGADFDFVGEEEVPNPIEAEIGDLEYEEEISYDEGTGSVRVDPDEGEYAFIVGADVIYPDSDDEENLYGSRLIFLLYQYESATALPVYGQIYNFTKGEYSYYSMKDALITQYDWGQVYPTLYLVTNHFADFVKNCIEFENDVHSAGWDPNDDYGLYVSGSSNYNIFIDRLAAYWFSSETIHHASSQNTLYHWLEDFEGNPKFNGNYTSTNNGRITKNSGYAYEGLYCLQMDCYPSGTYSDNTAEYKFNFSDYEDFSDITLEFDYMDMADETQGGPGTGDNVFIRYWDTSAEDWDYEPVEELNPGSRTDGVWYHVTVDLYDIIETIDNHGVDWDKYMWLSFEQYDNYASPSDGIYFDNLEVIWEE